VPLLGEPGQEISRRLRPGLGRDPGAAPEPSGIYRAARPPTPNIRRPAARSANKASLRLGESVGDFRAVHFGRTEEEAVALFRETNYAGFYHYFGGFGFPEAFRLPGDAEKYPPPTMLPQSEWSS
jgi:hypothetical protein